MDEEEENGEEESDHPVLKEFIERLQEVSQSGSLDQMRNLHSELHARHVMARQEAVKRVTNMIQNVNTERRSEMIMNEINCNNSCRRMYYKSAIKAFFHTEAIQIKIKTSKK